LGAWVGVPGAWVGVPGAWVGVPGARVEGAIVGVPVWARVWVTSCNMIKVTMRKKMIGDIFETMMMMIVKVTTMTLKE